MSVCVCVCVCVCTCVCARVCVCVNLGSVSISEPLCFLSNRTFSTEITIDHRLLRALLNNINNKSIFMFNGS